MEKEGYVFYSVPLNMADQMKSRYIVWWKTRFLKNRKKY